MISPIKTSINNNSQTSAQQKDSMFNSDTYSIPTNQKNIQVLLKLMLQPLAQQGFLLFYLSKTGDNSLNILSLLTFNPLSSDFPK